MTAAPESVCGRAASVFSNDIEGICVAAQRELVKSIDTLVPLINDKRP